MLHQVEALSCEPEGQRANQQAYEDYGTAWRRFSRRSRLASEASGRCYGQRYRTRDVKPGQPRQLDGLGPECKWVGCLKIPAKCLKGRHRLQIDGDLLGLIIERTSMNDLDVQPRQTRCRPCRVVFDCSIRHVFSPWRLVR